MEPEPRGSAPRSDRAPGPSDAELVSSARDGDRGAQRALYLRHVGLVKGLAYRMLGPGEDARDLVQDVFVLALGRLGRLEHAQAFASYVASITVRQAQKRYRRRRIAERLGLAGRDEQRFDALISPDCPPDVRSELESTYRALERMATPLRTVLLLRRVEGMQLTEIAEACDISLATVKRRLTQAEQELVRLTGRGPESG